jgi:hypothetical protein
MKATGYMVFNPLVPPDCGKIEFPGCSAPQSPFKSRRNLTWGYRMLQARDYLPIDFSR